MSHQSVLLQETIELLHPQPGACIVDCTLGAGGHSAALIEKISPGGRLIGLDVDPQAIALARAKLDPLAQTHQVRFDTVQTNYRRITSVLRDLQIQQVDGILADFGMSSMQLDQPERGFSFRFDAPLDMRMDPTLPMTAADILNTAGEEELANILYNFGGEHKSRRIARSLVSERSRSPITTTGQLEEAVRRALRIRGHRKIHPATKTFQALRIAVNQEIDAITEFLDAAPELLKPGGTLAIIAFHSLEDRPVKQRFKALGQTGRFKQLVKFVAPGRDEQRENPRSRSAKLRAIRATLVTEAETN